MEFEEVDGELRVAQAGADAVGRTPAASDGEIA